MLATTLRTCLLGGTLALASACSVPPATTTPSGSPNDRPSARPTAPVAQPIAIEDLPVIDPDPAVVTAVCDPEPIQVHPDAGDSTVFCNDAVVLGFRAASTVAIGSITRIYLQRPTCAASPCSYQDLNTATVLVWDTAGVVAVRVDSRLDAVTRPERITIAAWPSPVTNPNPETRREDVGPAPGPVAARTAYPFCGRATYDTPEEVHACFRDSVLLGRRVEVIQLTFGTEGREVIDIVRYDGAGALTRYRNADGDWVVQRGGLILPAPGGSWAVDPWDSGAPLE